MWAGYLMDLGYFNKPANKCQIQMSHGLHGEGKRARYMKLKANFYF